MWNTGSPSPVQKQVLQPPSSSGDFTQFIINILCFATHSEIRVALVSDGSDSFTTHSPGPLFCHGTSLSGRRERGSSSTSTPVEGTWSPPHSLHPLASGMTKVHGSITTPLHGCGRDVPVALLQLQSCKSCEAGILTHNLDTTSTVPGVANKTVPESWIQLGDSPSWRETPTQEELPQKTPWTAVSPAPRKKHEVPVGAQAARAALFNPTSRCVCSKSHQQPLAPQKVQEVGRLCGMQGYGSVLFLLAQLHKAEAGQSWLSPCIWLKP